MVEIFLLESEKSELCEYLEKYHTDDLEVFILPKTAFCYNKSGFYLFSYKCRFQFNISHEMQL
jgi:hypothetical protein